MARSIPVNGADLLVLALENEGVKWIFGVPGEENLAIVEALRRTRIELVLTRHEQAATFMAATVGRLSGHAGVCLSTLGPGALNLTTGAAFAKLGAMPMVMITGQKGVLSRKQAQFQLVDIVSTMMPLTKMARQIVSPATIPAIVREAFRVAEQERPGPVHRARGNPRRWRHQHATTADAVEHRRSQRSAPSRHFGRRAAQRRRP
jgi:acetolactate synthase-1/2/3 large subunit